jgi:hypothetical protein
MNITVSVQEHTLLQGEGPRFCDPINRNEHPENTLGMRKRALTHHILKRGIASKEHEKLDVLAKYAHKIKGVSPEGI